MAGMTSSQRAGNPPSHGQSDEKAVPDRTSVRQAGRGNDGAGSADGRQCRPQDGTVEQARLPYQPVGTQAEPDHPSRAEDAYCGCESIALHSPG